MGLDLYHRKRDFTRTSEPSGTRAAASGHAYLIQKHAARRLHYDLRLELDGVLKSWAVTRGPSLVPGEKRLAVHVEDHPLDYGTFEGTIPKGNYGAGTVMLWDTGHWEPVGDAHKGYKKGHLDFILHGEKLHGHWHLVRMAQRRGEKADNWLLIKGEDDAARSEGALDILEEQPNSVKTGRTLGEITAGAGPAKAANGKTAPSKTMPGKTTRAAPSGAATRTAGTAKAKANPKAASKAKPSPADPMPSFVAPELATLVAKTPTGAAWLHEIKFDGYRLQARIDTTASGKKTVRLLTRSGLDWTERFGPALTQALAALPLEQGLIDGELVVETGSGASNFSLLQQDLADGRHNRFIYYGFDLLYQDGRDLRTEPLLARKEALERILKDCADNLRYSAHFLADGDTMLRHACRLSLEGVVSKRRDAPYRTGRGRDWVKSKCAFRQEFVIGGYVPSTAQADAIGSLVLGVYDNGRLEHVGRVGTGFSQSVARALYARLSPLRRATAPFKGRLTAEEKRGATFVVPDLVAEVEFRGWTGDNHLRHAAFRGLREDKGPKDVVRETPKDVPEAPQAKPVRSGVKLTHPERVYWPEDGITKQGLAAYYGHVWPFIAPFVVARPLALLRCPDGVAHACFFQKHAWAGINKAIKIKKDRDGEELLVIEDFDGLIALAQAGALEIHPWGSSLSALDQPDMLIFDLDPADGVGWKAVVAGAREIRARLEAQGLVAFVKTSGGKGLHVVTPLVPQAPWEAAKAFAKALADSMAAAEPDKYIAVATKARRKGRIFIDYLRNGRGATAVAPYCPRARAGAAVSTPVSWDELGEISGPAQFTIPDVPVRLANLTADPWADFRAAARPLPDAKDGAPRPRARRTR